LCPRARFFSPENFPDSGANSHSSVAAAVRVIHDKSARALTTLIPNPIHSTADPLYSCSLAVSGVISTATSTYIRAERYPVKDYALQISQILAFLDIAM